MQIKSHRGGWVSKVAGGAEQVRVVGGRNGEARRRRRG